MHRKMDDELFRLGDHETKTQARLLKTDVLFRELDEKLEKIRCEGENLESRITPEETRVAEVLEAGELIRVELQRYRLVFVYWSL
ncbi:hypothetical protein B0H19DRAFT_529719 [Mycena capillaripes]|nr:hypothetical protein B0H19DRAFT_529719 [Mycena capillaripes]